jgi:cell division protease FtsH
LPDRAPSNGAGSRRRPTHDDVSAGAADDLQRATEIALEMVTRFGMDPKVGQRTYRQASQPFLPGAPTGRIEAAEVTAREIDVAVRDTLANAFKQASDILQSRHSDLEKGVELLLKRETVTTEEFPAIRSKLTPRDKAPELLGDQQAAALTAAQ